MLNLIFNLIFSNRKKDIFQNWFNAPVSETKSEKSEKRLELPIKYKKWVSPVDNTKITSHYGWRKLLGKRRWHSGTDFTGRNKFCNCPTDGIVIKILKPDLEYPVKFKYHKDKKKFVRLNIPPGRAWTPYVLIQCAWNKKLRFAFKHVSTLVGINEVIYAGERIAKIGNYGYSMGSHLHFEILKQSKSGKWKKVNPEKFLKLKGALT